MAGLPRRVLAEGGSQGSAFCSRHTRRGTLAFFTVLFGSAPPPPPCNSSTSLFTVGRRVVRAWWGCRCFQSRQPSWPWPAAGSPGAASPQPGSHDPLGPAGGVSRLPISWSPLPGPTGVINNEASPDRRVIATGRWARQARGPVAAEPHSWPPQQSGASLLALDASLFELLQLPLAPLMLPPKPPG